MNPIFLTIVRLHDDVIKCSDRGLETDNFSHFLNIVKTSYSDTVFDAQWRLKGSKGPAKNNIEGQSM